MKIAIATPAQAGPHWEPFHTDFLYPDEIRQRIHALVRAEELGGFERCLVTLNRTVLDLVTHPEIKNPGPVSYEDVVVWSPTTNALVPLLSAHAEDWLIHSSVGDLLERGLLTPAGERT
jgi:hypothetical protein